MATDKETRVVQDVCPTEQLFLSKITGDCLWNFSLLKVCMHLISNFTCKDTDFRVVALKFSQLNLKRPYWENLCFFFISIRACVENLHTKNCIKNLMVIMPSYFYKDIKDKTWNSSVKNAILVTSQTYKLPPLREKCPNTEFFLVRIFLHSDWIGRFTE